MQACENHGLAMEVIHVAKVGSVAKRQFRVCIDFRVKKRNDETGGVSEDPAMIV
jgi:hypothetical protein